MAKILLLDSSGQPLQWGTWQDAITYHAKGLVAWSIGEENTIARGGNSRMTGLQSVISTASIIAIKGNASSKRKYKSAPLCNSSLFRRDRCTCAYCGKSFSEHKLTRDHIIPKAQKGLDIWMNVVAACASCNQRKNDRTPEQANMQLLFAPYIPNRAEHLILANRNVLADQMSFLVSFIPENSRLHPSKIRELEAA